LTGRFWFKGAPTPDVLATPQTTPQASTRLSESAEAWTLTKDTTRVSDLETFIRRFSDTYYGDLAAGRLEELRSEQQRLALLQKQEADRKRADAADAEKAALDRKNAEEEAARKAEAEAEAKRKAEMEAEAKAKAQAEAEARKRAEDIELKRLGALQTEVDKKKAEPQDTHGFLGTWKCVSTGPSYKNGEKLGTTSGGPGARRSLTIGGT
jgi:uncharacterized membrane protein YqiK